MFCRMVGPFLLVLFCPKRILWIPFPNYFHLFGESEKYLNLKCSFFWRPPWKSSTPMVFAMRKRRDRLPINLLKIVITFNNVDIHRNHIVAWLPANVVEVMVLETNVSNTNSICPGFVGFFPELGYESRHLMSSGRHRGCFPFSFITLRAAVHGDDHLRRKLNTMDYHCVLKVYWIGPRQQPRVSEIINSC